MTNQESILNALKFSRTLSSNEPNQAAAKHLIQELAHRLDRARTINCDQVAWMLAGIERYLGPVAAPRVSRAREMQKYALLYELMEVSGLTFEDREAASNGTPRDVTALQRCNQPYAGDMMADTPRNTAAMAQEGGLMGGVGGLSRS